MPYSTREKRHVDTQDATLPSAARTVTGQSAEFQVGGKHTVRGFLDVTAVSGTAPSMTLSVETSHDGTTGWRNVGSFAAKTATGTERKAFSGLDKFVRWQWAISGTTPSFTFSCSADMVGKG